MAAGGRGSTKALLIKEADREKREMFSSVIEWLDWGKAEGILEPCSPNTSDIQENGAGGVVFSQLVSKKITRQHNALSLLSLKPIFSSTGLHPVSSLLVGVWALAPWWGWLEGAAAGKKDGLQPAFFNHCTGSGRCVTSVQDARRQVKNLTACGSSN